MKAKAVSKTHNLLICNFSRDELDLIRFRQELIELVGDDTC